MSNSLLILTALFPFFGFFVSLFLPTRKEKLISLFSISVVGFHLIVCHIVFLIWFFGDKPYFSWNGVLLYSTNGVDFYLSFLYDKISLVFTLVGSILTFLVVVYSRIYMHRESGYKRFFATILLFYSGYLLICLSGNFEILFAGWEILGISSFLLISYYRERYLPVKNALKVFSIYRLGDIGLVMVAWLGHMTWHKNIQFFDFFNDQFINSHTNLSLLTIMGGFILLSASAKSAQFPFSSWLPRAMEGPTPSSAIFYGSLSIHMGVFLLLRTEPLWSHSIYIVSLMIFFGVTTALVSNGIAKVQSAIKSQIAYSSLTQIGLMFVEIALGFKDIALIHFAGNAFLRTYQLLVSPSIVSYLIGGQVYHGLNQKDLIEKVLPRSWVMGIYVLSIKEWDMDTFLERRLWQPIKRLGYLFRFVSHTKFIYFLILISILMFINLALFNDRILFKGIAGGLFAVFALLMVLLSFTERQNAMIAWLLIMCNHIWITTAVMVSNHLSQLEVLIYLSGVILSGFIGLGFLLQLRSKEKSLSLNSFQGHVYEHPYIGFAFLICCLALSGFPITPTFIGEDVIFHHIKDSDYVTAICAALSYIIDGLAILRIYSRVFLGPHIKPNHEVAIRSA